MKVRSKEFPQSALVGAEIRRRSGDFEVAHIRHAMLASVLTSGVYATRKEAYNAVDQAGTRLISKWAKEGKIKKVPGTRRWVAA